MRIKKLQRCLFYLVFVAILVGCAQTKLRDNSEITSSTKLVIKATYPKNTIVWRLPTPLATPVGEFSAKRQEELNNILQARGVEYSVVMEEYNAELPRDADKNHICTDLFKQFENSNIQTDLITSAPTSYDIDMNKVSPYEEFCEAGYFLPLDTFLQSAEASALKKKLPQEDLNYSKLNGVTYGISSFMPAYHGTAYHLDALKLVGINPNELRGNVWQNKKQCQELKKAMGHAPLHLSTIDIRSSLAQLALILPDYNVVYDRHSGSWTSGVAEQLITEFYNAKEWEEDGILKMSSLDVPAGNSSTKDKHIITRYLPHAEIETDEIKIHKNSEGDKIIVVPDTDRPYLSMDTGDRQTGIASWSEKTEQAKDFLLKLFTDEEIANLIQYGVEGKDYHKDAEDIVEQVEKTICEVGLVHITPII